MQLVTAASKDDQQVVLGLIGVISFMATILIYVLRTYGQAKQANSAVNHVEFGEARLFDRIIHIQEVVAELSAANAAFQAKGWTTLPDEFGDASSLSVYLVDLKHGQDRIEQMLMKHIEETAASE